MREGVGVVVVVGGGRGRGGMVVVGLGKRRRLQPLGWRQARVSLRRQTNGGIHLTELVCCRSDAQIADHHGNCFKETNTWGNV